MPSFSKRKALWIFVRAMLPGPKSWLTTVAGLAMIMAAAFAGQSACYPWAHSITFGPTLTGAWLGELMPAIGAKHIVFLELSADIGESDDNLSGTARLCDATGDSRQFGVIGSTQNWRGTRFRVTSFITEHRDGRGVQMGKSEGEWDTRDALRINAHLLIFEIRAGGSISTTARPPEQIVVEDTPVAFTLRRSNSEEFLAACRALAR